MTELNKGRLQGAAYTIAVVLAVWGGLILVDYLQNGEDDRPPIIVTNGGSILLEAQDKGGRGEWKVDGFDVIHEHSKKETVRLLVTIAAGPTVGVCKKKNQPIGVLDEETHNMTLVYSNGVNDENIRIWTGPKGLRVDARGNGYAIVDKYKLMFKKDMADWKLKFANVHQPGGGIECDFGSTNPTITITQKWKS